MNPGPLIILSGPSGSGKSTVIRRLLGESGLPLRLSVSATTRPVRKGERDGVDYYFWTREHFQEQVRAGAFLEWLVVLDDLKEEAIVNKVGGRFKLSTLIQKRMIMLNQGARPLVEVRGGDKMSIVVQEILQDKIYLDTAGQVQTRVLSPGDPA